MNDHIETPDTEDVEGHVLFTDGIAAGPGPSRLRVSITDDEDDVAGHVLDLDIERKR